VSDRRPTTVTLDLSGVTFIDARGVSLLSRLAQHLASWDGSLAITRPSHVVTRLLALVGIDRDLRVVCPTGSHDGHAERPQVALGEYGSVGRL
jgi:anti-anti-sigma factor